MSEELQPPNPNGAPQLTLEEMADKLKQFESTNSRLLDENKKFKERAKRSESEYEKVIEEVTGKEKDVNKVIEAERKRIEKLADENKKLRSETLNSKIRSALSRYAGDVNDLDDLLNQPKYADILKRGIDIDELTVDEEVVKEYCETVFKAKPYLKKQEDATKIFTKKPGFNVNEKNKTLDEMKGNEIEDMLHKLYGNK
jgi:hypothetical protein